MGIALKVVGSCWGVLGILNVAMCPAWAQINGRSDTAMLTLNIMFNIAIFITPGLVLAGIGVLIDKK